MKSLSLQKQVSKKFLITTQNLKASDKVKYVHEAITLEAVDQDFLAAASGSDFEDE
jgi:hypothetical protein